MLSVSSIGRSQLNAMYAPCIHYGFLVSYYLIFRQKTSGDFPTVLFEVVSKRSSVIEGSLSIDDLNDILDELSKNMGKQ